MTLNNIATSQNGSRQAIEKIYWDRYFSAGKETQFPREAFVRFIAKNQHFFSDVESNRVLELGCGKGTELLFMMTMHCRCSAIDGSIVAISRLRERLAACADVTDTDLDVQHGDFRELSWESAQFDIVYDIEALYANEYNDITKIVNEIHRVLKPGGQYFGLLFGQETTGAFSGISSENGSRIWPDSGPCAGNPIAHFFTRSQLEDLFCNFSNLKIDTHIRSENDGAYTVFEWQVVAHK